MWTGSSRSSIELDLEARVQERELAQPLGQLLALELHVSVKISGSGQKRIVVPVFVAGLALGQLGRDRPRAYSWCHVEPSRGTSAVELRESAFTTETPTPCRPPEIV